MKHSRLSKVLALLLVTVMFLGALPLSAFAIAGGYNENVGSTYYNVISEKEWDLAPGVKETELVLNNAEGTRRQVLHTAIIDVNNPYVKVIPGTKGMEPDENGNWPMGFGTQSTSTQALEAEKLGYGNVVVATNCSLSWYTEAYYKQNPHLIGEPLGYSILDGRYYANSRIENGTLATGGVATILVINYDNHPLTGEPRPADMPKTWIRSSTDPLTGWEQQAIPVLFTFLVKPDANGNPVNQYSKENHTSDIASRTFVGVKADGTIVLAVSDGEQAPYSAGFTPYEMADYMIKMGCVIAANCDGGGSTTFCSQRPGEDLKVNCSLSDGGERPTSNTILVVSTAPADGVFAQANISSDYAYYTPGSSVTFNALGTDAVGTKVEIPDDVQWAIKEEGMGSIENGVFTSNGTEGKVTAQMIYDGKVMGERSVTIVTPDKLSFEQPVVTIPFGKTAKIPVKATAVVNGVAQEIGLGANDVTFTTTNTALGSFSGLDFTAVAEENAPADLTSTVIATLNMGANPTATVQLNLGKGSEVLWDFEGGQADIDEWNVINNRKNAAHWDYYLNLSLADRTNGQVHDGEYSLRLETNGLSSKDSHSEQYAWIRLGVDGEAITLKNARRVGFWLYVPEDNIQCWVQWHYMTDSNGDGVVDTENVVSVMEAENVYYNIDESGWHYLSMDVSAFEEIVMKAATQYDKDPSDGMTGEKGEFFLAIVFHKAINNKLWQENGSINGNYTYYLDNFTVDYSEAVDDRENPVFDKIYVDDTTALVKRDVVTVTNNVLNLSAAVADQSVQLDANKNEVPLHNATGLDASTAKVYIDGVEVDCTFDGSKMVSNGNVVADGYHRVKFEICDKAGNKSVVIRVVKVESGVASSTISLVPDDATLDRIPFGSIYWMNLKATNIETIRSVQTVIDLNNVNHWQLDHMYLADGFSATYTIAEETNTATITITRTGDNTQSGEAVLAKLPVRILYFDTDIKTPGYTAQTYWTTYSFWAQDMKMDVDMGLITHVDGKTSTFSNEEFHVDTEMYTSMANMDKEYFSAHGTTHVHTPAAIADQAPTCTQPGYTGRTFCAGCNSVVDWGTTVAATGHTYTVDLKNKALVCDCSSAYSGTGLVAVDGKNYYAVNGTLQSGWITVDDEWYYFDAKTFAGVDGNVTADKGVAFDFDNGRLTKGTWVTTAEGTRYWYGPSYYRDTSPHPRSSRPYEIDGKLYLFGKKGYLLIGVGISFLGGETTLYIGDENGVASLYTGPFEDHFYEDGVQQKAYRLVEWNGDYYYISDRNMLAKDVTLSLNKALAGTGLPAGKYYFDAEGKMVIPETPDEPAPDAKNGVVGKYFYINDVKQLAYQLILYEGHYYYISDGHMVAKDVTLYLNKVLAGTGLPAGKYYFDAEGRMVLDYESSEPETEIPSEPETEIPSEPETEIPSEPETDAPSEPEIDSNAKNGVVGKYFYINDVKQLAYQLILYEGHYYYVSDGHMVAKDVTLYLNKALAGTGLSAGKYYFDAEGKMVIPETPDEPAPDEPNPDAKNGVVGKYFYLNDVKQLAYQLILYEGHYYYISDGHMVAKDVTLYLNKALAGTGLPAGKYYFAADGKMIID